MSVEDRLLHLLNQARQGGGDAALQDAATLRSRLSSQAPDLYGEIQAMAAALALGAPVRIAQASDSNAERAAVAAEIARQERLSLSVVEPGLAAACIGGAGIGPAAASNAPPSEPPPQDDAWAGDSIVVDAGLSPQPHRPGDDGWAGDSLAVGAGSSPAAPPPSLAKASAPPPIPAPPAPPFAAPPPFMPPPQTSPHQPPYAGGHGAGGYGVEARPFYTQTWFFALVAAIIIAAAVGYTIWRNSDGGAVASNGPVPPQPTPPQPNPQPVPPPQPGPLVSEVQPGGPVLSTDASNPTPLRLKTMVTGRYAVGFRVVTNAGPIDGVVILPAGGWNGEAEIIGSNGAGATARGSGRFVLEMVTEQSTPARVMPVTWSEDNVGAGDTQIVFLGRPGQTEVTPHNSVMCIADGTGTEIVGCGEVR